MSFSLRGRLNWIMLGLIIASWVTSAALTAIYAGRVVNDQIEQQLIQYTDLVSYVTRIFAREMDEDVEPISPWLRRELSGDPMVPLLLGDGVEGQRRGVMPALNVWLGDRLIATLEGSPRFERPTKAGFSLEVRGEEGSHWRLLSRYDEATELWIVVGFELDTARWELLKILGRTLIPLLVILPLSLVSLYWGVSRALRPINRVALQIGRRNPSLLDPIEETNAPREVEPLLNSLNDLLARLAEGIDSEQRFTANAAHELMTPLAAIKTEVQLCQRRLTDESNRRMLDRIVARVDRATHTVEQLLALARLDPAAPMPTAALDLGVLLTDVVADTAHLAAANNLQPEIVAATGQKIEGNAEAVAMLLRNLLANAFRYATPGTAVAVVLRPLPGSVELEICNDCAPLSAEEFRHITDRFYRVPGSAGLGAGLGLSIVSRVADQHDAEFCAVPWSEEGGFCARVLFPALS